MSTVTRQKMKSWMQKERNLVVGRKNTGKRRTVIIIVVRMMVLRE